jgi:hypothetical protein
VDVAVSLADKLAGLDEEEAGGGLFAGDGPGIQQIARLLDQEVLERLDAIRSTSEQLEALARSRGAGRPLFQGHIAYGLEQLMWMKEELSFEELLKIALTFEDPDFALGILRMPITRLTVATFACALLDAWVDFLKLADFMLQRRGCSDKWLLRRLAVARRVIERPLTQIEDLHPGGVEATAITVPGLMDRLSREYERIQEHIPAGTKGGIPVAAGPDNVPRAALQMRWVPRAPAGIPSAAGKAMMVSADGVRIGGQVVASAGWVELMRWLIQVGALLPSVAGAALRIKAGQTWRIQTDKDFPVDVRQAFGSGPEVVPRCRRPSIAWKGDWVARLYDRTRAKGYDSLTAFAAARPTVSLVAMAEELGGDELAGVQVFRGLLDGAERGNWLERFERDILARALAEELPGGWPAVLDDKNRSKVADALSSWVTYTPEMHQERARQIMHALLASPPPPGWRPLGPDDELLRELLPDVE